MHLESAKPFQIYVSGGVPPQARKPSGTSQPHLRGLPLIFHPHLRVAMCPWTDVHDALVTLFELRLEMGVVLVTHVHHHHQPALRTHDLYAG